MLTIMNERDRRYADRFLAERELVTALITALTNATQASVTAQKEAVSKAEAAQDLRLEGMNEFRDQLRSQAATFMSKDEADARFTGVADRIESMTSTLTGKIETNTAAITAGLASLENRVNLSTGTSTGRREFWGYILGALGGVAIIISIVVTIITLTN